MQRLLHTCSDPQSLGADYIYKYFLGADHRADQRLQYLMMSQEVLAPKFRAADVI
jgi:hypothetical protein